MAVAAGLLMLTVAADQSVANLGLLDPTVSTESANGSNNTTPPTPPPEPLLPPDEPQRPVDPGTVTNGWDNSTLAPSNVSPPQDVVARNSENGTEYDTAYGNFLLNNSSRSFVEVISPGPNPQKIGESVFLVLYEGLLLSPGNEIADDTNASELSVSYSLYSSALLMGNMTVDYLFYSDRNKITISFSPSVGSPDQYQIVWLTFTNWDVVDTAFPDDIDIMLAGPNGQAVMLMSDTGGRFALATNVTLTFDDAATDLLPDSSRIFPGVYKPTDFEPGDTMETFRLEREEL